MPTILLPPRLGGTFVGHLNLIGSRTSRPDLSFEVAVYGCGHAVPVTRRGRRLRNEEAFEKYVINATSSPRVRHRSTDRTLVTRGPGLAAVLHHVIRRLRARWPRMGILIRGDSHFGHIEAITLCEHPGAAYIFGLGGNPVLLRKMTTLAEDAAVARIKGAVEQVPAAAARLVAGRLH